uniref:Uncharacterized protein n=1 Tax=Timspurckia oligopyrenoides TaxID=708627 RepID=A0A7S1EPU4_9RHOD|mmetsp:Transcript_11412/g.20645  ORF Transcript_11412/g.20645 Transcript_11412/m.20645 type:complete len:178 (+) Transcript_11412:58-591(+)
MMMDGVKGEYGFVFGGVGCSESNVFVQRGECCRLNSKKENVRVGVVVMSGVRRRWNFESGSNGYSSEASIDALIARRLNSQKEYLQSWKSEKVMDSVKTLQQQQKDHEIVNQKLYEFDQLQKAIQKDAKEKKLKWEQELEALKDPPKAKAASEKPVAVAPVVEKVVKEEKIEMGART